MLNVTQRMAAETVLAVLKCTKMYEKNVQKAEVRTGIKYGFQMTNTFESTKINFEFCYYTSKMGVLNYATNARRF